MEPASVEVSVLEVRRGLGKQFEIIACDPASA
jgi:hypothetical protein